MKDIYATGTTYFIAVRTYHDEPVFRSAALCVHFLESMKYYRSQRYIVGNHIKEEHRVKIVSYCVLPAQYVLLIKQEKHRGLHTFLKRVNATMSYYYNALYKKMDDVFSEPYISSEIIDLNELYAATRYIHSLPVRENMINDGSDAATYPWSSYREIMGQDTRAVCDAEEILQYFPSLQDYQDFIRTGQVKDVYV